MEPSSGAVYTGSGTPPTAYVRLGRTQAAKPPAHRRALFRRPAVVAVSIIVLVPAIIVAAVIANSSHPPVVIAPEGLAALAPSGAVLESVSLGGHPTAVAGGFGSEWVTSTTTDQLFRIDRTTKTTTIIPVGSQPEGVAVGAGAVWVAASGDGKVDRISPLSNTVVDAITVGTGPDDVAYYDGSIWVSDSLAATVSEIDPTRNAVIRRVPTEAEPTGIAGGDGDLWVADEGDATVLRIDPSTGDQVSPPIHVGNGPTALAYGDGAAWVTNSLDGSVSRIDPTDDRVTTSTAGAGADAVAVADERVWVGNEDADTLSEYSSGSGAAVRTLWVASAPTGINFSDGRLWLASDGVGSQAHRGGVLVVDSAPLGGGFDPGTIDPGSAYSSQLWRILVMTNDGLVGYKRVGGLQGGTLVPDLATFLPSPTDGGLTYSFQLRSGIRYSNGQPVLASDFRYGLERAFKVGGGPTQYFTAALVGGAGCAAHPTRCSLAKGIQTDNRTGAVVFHLVKPDPDFLDQLALPIADAIPRSTPVDLRSGSTVPATGPYKILSYRPALASRTGIVSRPGRLVLIRNPDFRQWSAAAQPEGFPGRIIVNTGLPLPIEIRAVERGKADTMWDSPTETEYLQMKASYPTQIYTNSAPFTSYFFLNIRLAPFSSLAVRRAVSFALDRHALMSGAAIDGVGGGAISCQVLPPDFPSYEPYCPYTLDAGNGIWTAPDLHKAQVLMAQSGMKGTRVTVVTCQCFDNSGQVKIFVRTLNHLGLVAHLRVFPSMYTYFYSEAGIPDSANHIQAGFAVWESDYIAASNFFEPLLSCHSFQPNSAANVNFAEFCSPEIDRLINRAAAAQQSNPGSSVALWTKVDRAVVGQAPWIPIANLQNVDFLSRRVGGYQYNPQFGELTDLLSIQ